MPWVLAIGAAVAAAGGGVAGAISSADDREAANRAAEDAYREILRVGAPPDQSAAIALKHFQSAGILTPEIEEAIMLGPSGVAKLQENRETRDAQMSALQLLMERAQGGFTAEDRAAFNQLRNQVATDNRARQDSVVQNFQSRGMGGSGAELAAALSGAQSSSNRAAMQAADLGAAASRNALQAALSSGQLGGQIRQMDWDVARTKASAQDEFDRFNTEQQIARQQRNVSSKNRAKEYNLTNEQRILDANTTMENAERYRQSEAQRRYWLDQMEAAKARSGALSGKSATHRQQAQDKAQMWQNIGSGVAAGLGAGANAMARGAGGSKGYGIGGKVQSDTPQYGPWAGGYGLGDMDDGYYEW